MSETESLSIPKAAMPAVEILRRDVKRPGDKPRQGRWTRSGERFGLEETQCCCPMGLHPDALSPAPEGNEFPLAPERAVADFAIWWDDLPFDRYDEAVDAIWPEEKTL